MTIGFAPLTDDQRKTHCCFTGHRPQFLKRPEDDIKADLENSILQAMAEGYTTFISGMACGVDIWAAEIVVRLMDSHPELRLVAAVPFPGFDKAWDEDWRRRYSRLLSRAEYVKILRPAFSRGIYQQRNEWMVDHSSKVIAVYNGRSGGTRNTIRYARRCKVPVILLVG